jgi:molybdopterin-guanine dinucleotide biosynthesis protein A
MTTTISAVILAGGLARRMDGRDKGLQSLAGQPLISHVIARLAPQIQAIAINANRHHDEYGRFGYPVFSDELPDFQGPLSGMLSGLKRATTDWVLFVPCDSPYFPINLADKLQAAVATHNAPLAYAQDEEREHPTFCLMSVQLQAALRTYLAGGGRRLLEFMREHGGIAVSFSTEEGRFVNFNTLADLQTASETPQ